VGKGKMEYEKKCKKQKKEEGRKKERKKRPFYFKNSGGV
jgi:hypothetical protein